MNKKTYIPPENQRLKDFRIRTGRNQKAIADVLGITQSGYSAIERGKCKLTHANIRRLTKEFNLNPEWLLNGISPMLIARPRNEIPLIPLFADIPAGPWEYWYDSYATGTGDEYIPAISVQGKNLFAISQENEMGSQIVVS